MKKKATYHPEHRTHVITVRMNEDEWQMFQQRLQDSGMMQSDFVRQAVATAKVDVHIHPVYDSEVLDQIASELGKIGSNMNQIARHLNQGNPMTARLSKNLNHCFADLTMLKTKIEEMAGEM